MINYHQPRDIYEERQQCERAIDKRYYKGSEDGCTGKSRDDWGTVNKDAKTLTISDSGIGMSKEELENNLRNNCQQRFS